MKRVLKQHGYRWNYDLVHEEGPANDPRDPGKYWFIVSPDGKRMSKSQAFSEIELGTEIARAWDEAIAENKRRDEEAKQRDEDAQENAFYAAKEAAIAGMVKVARFDYSGFNTIASWHYGITTRCVQVGEINGIKCAVTETVGDGDYITFYCEDPSTAGLTVKPHTSTEDDYSWLFE